MSINYLEFLQEEDKYSLEILNKKLLIIEEIEHFSKEPDFTEDNITIEFLKRIRSIRIEEKDVLFAKELYNKFRIIHKERIIEIINSRIGNYKKLIIEDTEFHKNNILKYEKILLEIKKE